MMLMPVPSQGLLAVRNRMRDMAIDEVVTWAELESLTGSSREAVRGYVLNARRFLMREESKHYRTIIGDGIERIDYSEVANTELPKHRKKVTTRARVMLKTSQAVVLTELKDQSERATVLGHMVAAQLTIAVNANDHVKRLSGDIEREKNLRAPLSVGDALSKYLEYENARGAK